MGSNSWRVEQLMPCSFCHQCMVAQIGRVGLFHLLCMENSCFHACMCLLRLFNTSQGAPLRRGSLHPGACTCCQRQTGMQGCLASALNLRRCMQ